MKTKEQVNSNWKPAFFAYMYTNMKKEALELGYALAIHWSLQNDMDILAVAWTEEARPYEELVQKIEDCIWWSIFKFHNTFSKEIKPHWRIAYSLNITPDVFIDLSIIPPKNETELKSKIDTLQRYSTEDIDELYITEYNNVYLWDWIKYDDLKKLLED